MELKIDPNIQILAIKFTRVVLFKIHDPVIDDSAMRDLRINHQS